MQNKFKYVPPHLRKEQESEKARAQWDAQRKKQKKEENQEESRRKLQPARKPFDNGVRLARSCMEPNPRTFNQFEGQEDGRKEEEEGDNDVSYVPPSSLRANFEDVDALLD